ncbi:MAG: glycosyltransferase [Tabrizicola sp.]|nr:glycosyltransferase [Tabrizicola sp.]
MPSTYSFVLLSYNQEEYIADAVRSVLDQQGPPLEIILSDDCSTDSTYQIMRNVAAGYTGPHRVTIRRNETNLGFVKHFREVFTRCTGDVMIVAWGDDVSLPDRALAVREAFSSGDPWLVHSHAACIDLAGNDIPPTYLTADLVKGSDLAACATSGGLYLGATGAYHRKLVQKYGHVTNPRAYEDLVYGFRAMLEDGVRFIDKPLVRYRVGSGLSTSHLLADRGGKRKAEIRRLRTQYAVLSQRRRDALVFGMFPQDSIPQLINHNRLQVLFELYFWGAINRERARRLLFQHPLLALRAWRRVRRFKRRIKRSLQAMPTTVAVAPAP